jgi:aspartokinase-like uncharacterized kinase
MDHDTEEAVGLISTTVAWSESIHADATGRFPTQSRAGNNYLLVTTYKGYIHAVAMPSRSGPSYVQAYSKVLTHYKKLGLSLSEVRLDNEKSTELENYLTSECVIYQYVPPNNHRANKAERAIRTFKNHLIAILATTHRSFPAYLWDELLPQALLTINILHPYKLNQTISAYDGIHGHKHDHDAHPLAPCGTPVIVHEAPDKRTSWGPHGLPGFYLGPAMDHYRCYRIYVVATQSIRISDTIAWMHDPLYLPGASAHELAIQAVEHVAESLNRLTTAPATADIVTEISEMRKQITEALNQIKEPAKASIIASLQPESEAREGRKTQEHVNEPSERPERPRRQIRTPARYRDDEVSVNAAGTTKEGGQMTYLQAIKGPDSVDWLEAACTEIKRLVNTGTINFIMMKDLPKGRTSAYYNPQCELKSRDGVMVYRIRGTIGGDKVDYPGERAAYTADMATIKLLLNAANSEKAKWITADIKDYYLGTPLLRKEYMRIHRRLIPNDIITLYNLEPMFQNDYILVEVAKGIYGLPQAGKLAQDLLIQHLASQGYTQATNTPCLFSHITRNIKFTLVVDDFGIKYDKDEDIEHLLTILKAKYEITVDWSGSKYIDMTI